jgi:chaperonin GroES
MAKLLEEFEVLPVGNFVILKRGETKEMSEGGIHLIKKSNDKSLQATVLAVGPGSVVNGGSFVPTTVKAGDVVLIDRIGGFELEVNEGEKLLVVREPEIIAVIRRK